MTSFPTIASAARDIAAKRISPVELMKDHLARSEKLNPALHAFIRFTPEIALEQAQAAEARQAAGALRGQLDGIPIAHKDIYETAGVTTTGHSRVLEHHVPKIDSAVVRRWRMRSTSPIALLAPLPWKAARLGQCSLIPLPATQRSLYWALKR